MSWAAGLLTDSNGVVSYSSTENRKIRLYRDLSNGIDTTTGHGTHVMGTLLGAPLDAADLNIFDYRHPFCMIFRDIQGSGFKSRI